MSKSDQLIKAEKDLASAQSYEKVRQLEKVFKRRKNKLQYAYSTDEECYFGNFDSILQAAVEGLTDDPETEVIYVGEVKQRSASYYVSGSDIIDGIKERAWDDASEWSESWLSGFVCNDPRLKELEELVGTWLEKHDPVSFFRVEAVVKYTRDELELLGELDSIELT